MNYMKMEIGNMYYAQVVQMIFCDHGVFDKESCCAELDDELE